MTSHRPRVVLTADDFALSEGVTAGIERLAQLGRLSATSALVTLPRWQQDAPRLKALRPLIAVGLHLDLTLGRPLAAMPRLCPDDRFPSLRTLLLRAAAGRIEPKEIAGETRRQIEAFVAGVGALPDHLDGHAHVHVLRGVRQGVLAALAACDPDRRVIVRDPADRLAAIRKRGLAVRKASLVALLARGFGKAARAHGFVTNASFAGFSSFRVGADYGRELAASLDAASTRHLVMCHPGFPDEELAGLDPVTERRREELVALERADWLAARLARPDRSRAVRPVFWHGQA